jgi:hypothetical protein
VSHNAQLIKPHSGIEPQHEDVITINEIDKLMFLVDTPRPATGKNMTQRLWPAMPPTGSR